MQVRLSGKIRKIAVLSVLSLVVSAGSATALSAAETKDSKDGVASREGPADGAGSSDEVRFVSNPGSVKQVKYLGSAPYICTPSGSGERAKCFLRSSLRTRSR